MKIKLSYYISQFLEEHGVTDGFMVTGGGAMHLNDAFGHSRKLHIVYNHHEQGCSIAAESYARMTGKIALCCVTSGPGGTNAITGVMGGWLDSIPMFVISGQVKRETTLAAVPELELRQLGDQEFDIIHSVSNMTKYAAVIDCVEDVRYHLEKAWFLANSGRKGPVWLDVPLDVQGAMIETEGLKGFDPASEGYETVVPKTSESTIAEVLKKISEARSPLIFAGYGVRLSDSNELLLKLADKLQIPVAVAWNSGDLVAYNNPYYAGSPSREGTRGSAFIVQSADLILVLGSRMNIRTITYNKHDFAKNAYKIMVDIDENELRKPTFVPDMPIRADVNTFIKQLLELEYTPNPNHERWVKWTGMMVRKYPACLPEYHGTEMLNPYVFVDKLFDHMESRDVLTLGNGSACVMCFSGAKIKQGQRMYTNSGCAAMGYGMPASLGAAVAVGLSDESDRRVICVDGDGSLMMNIQELETISYNRYPVKLFVLNNNGYHSIRQTQTNLFGTELIGLDPSNGVGFPKWESVAEAFGFKYIEIDSEESCDENIKRVFEESGPVLCNVVVDPGQNFVPKLSSKVLEDGSIVSPSMDDMFPFLPRDEYESNRYV